MVLNDIAKEVKIICIQEDKNQQDIAQAIGSTAQYVNRVLNRDKSPIVKSFVEIMESLGYDIKLEFVKKGE